MFNFLLLNDTDAHTHIQLLNDPITAKNPMRGIITKHYFFSQSISLDDRIFINCVYFIVLRQLKEKRKKTQEMNKKAKEDAKRAQKEKIIKEANEQIVEDDDKEYYRQEIGEEPDAGNIKLL